LESINWQEIQQLLNTLEQTSVVELTLEVNEFRLVLRRGGVGPPPGAPQNPEVAIPVTPPVEAAAVEDTAPPKRKPPVIPSHWVDQTAPMVGTFYAAPAPGEPDFVSLGDRVQKGQTLCIIEAMKLMNELEAETSGRIVEILVQNGQPVEFGQVLMRIEPG
jgi:acetyl-CoA carboxylase biotin carboxyl carrier protein